MLTEQEFVAELGARTQDLNLPVEDETLQRLARFACLLAGWNQRFNLTALNTAEEFLEKHFLDSLLAGHLARLPADQTLLDVGTGAGFPGLVLRIAWPHLQVTLLDSVAKKLRFLEHVCEDLDLADVTLIHGRAENLGAAGGHQAIRPSGREAFDVVTARAVAPMNVLAEWTLPLARVGGRVVAMKGPAIAEELAQARGALHEMGGGEPGVQPYVLCGGTVQRSLAEIPKIRPTPPGYPRPPGSARKRPL